MCAVMMGRNLQDVGKTKLHYLFHTAVVNNDCLEVEEDIPLPYWIMDNELARMYEFHVKHNPVTRKGFKLMTWEVSCFYLEETNYLSAVGGYFRKVT